MTRFPLNRLALNLGLVAMEVCWLTPWAVLLGLWLDASQPSQLLSPPSILALVLLGSLSTHAFGRQAASRRGARLILASLGLLVTSVAVRVDQYPAASGLDWLGGLLAALAVGLGQLSPPVVAFGLGLFLWWRGVRLGTQTASVSDVEAAFRWGLGLLLGCLLIVAITTRPSLRPSLEAHTLPFVVGYFFFSLLTLALGRLESLRTGTRSLAVNSQWLSVLFATSGAVVLVALIVGQLLSFDLLIVASRPLLDLVGQLIVILIALVVIPLAYVVQFLIYLLLSLVNPDLHRQPPQPYQPGEIVNLLSRLLSAGLPPELLGVLRPLGAALILGAAVLLIARAASRWRSATDDPDAADEERDSLWDGEHLKRTLMAWLRHLFSRPGGRLTPIETVAEPSSVVGVTPARASVRELYRQLLQMGDSVGARRRPSRTPLQHLATLETSLVPVAELENLTAAYVEVRYAEREVAADRIDRLRDQLAHVRPRDAQG